MGMESVYKLSVILNLVDNLSGQMNNVQSSVSGSVDKLNSAFGTMQKAGVAMAGIGGTITGLAMKTVTATFDTQNALGELSSLGVKDLKAVEDAAKSFSNTWAGTSKADFITASYDIKSGIASLTDEGVAQFTQLAALTGKATKSTTEEMGSLFATGYGIYKGFYDDMSDLEFGEMFSAGIATAVKNYKTSGSEMASAISALGATATNANVPLEEQLAISMIHLDGVDYVTNEDDWLFEEGAEEEDLEDLRDRCMSSWAELATRTIEEKLRNAAKAVPGVLDARIDAQHPRGQGTVDVIVTGAAGEASPELIRKVGEAIEPLKGNYEDYLVKSSEVVRQDFELVIYLAEDAATDGVDAQATKLIEDMMALTRGEMNTLYRDSIIQVLSTKIDNYRKTDILQPSDDMVLEQDKVIMAGDINVTVRNVVQSARGKE